MPPFRVLGLHDAHDAGVVLLEDGHIVYASNEERFSRKKYHWGFPFLSMKNLFDWTGIVPAHIDAVAVSGLTAFEDWSTVSFEPADMNAFRRYGQHVVSLLGPVTDTKAFAAFVQTVGQWRRHPERVVEAVRRFGIAAPVTFYDHHTCHAAGAYYTAARDRVLVVTADGSGDALAGSVSIGEKGRITRIAQSSIVHSAGRFWDVITHLCGFKPVRHAGKITGLAAYTPSPEAYARLRTLYGGNATYLRFDNKERKIWHHERERIRTLLPNASREALAYAAQKVLEESFVTVIRSAIRRTGIRDVALAGGTFANVRLNQILGALSEVNSLHIFPNMGDGGLAMGAAFIETAKRLRLRPFRLEHLYFGPAYTDEDIRAAARSRRVDLEALSDPAETIARELAAKRVVAVYEGRLEFGPRALGHRSILAEPTDVTMMNWLNKRLERTEFMPFAPIIMEEAAPRYFTGFGRHAYPAQFMTICFDVTEEGKQKAPGIVHKDGTARPQTVSRAQQPLIHAVLTRYNTLTGLPLCVNTSFNKHEEPIVCTPGDALAEFLRGGADTLVLGRYRVHGPRRP